MTAKRLCLVAFGLFAAVCVSARRNPFGDDADAKAVASELAAMGARTFIDDDGLKWSLKVSASGVATISRTTGSGKSKKTVSATAVVEIDGDYAASARFAVGGKIIRVEW